MKKVVLVVPTAVRECWDRKKEKKVVVFSSYWKSIFKWPIILAKMIFFRLFIRSEEIEKKLIDLEKKMVNNFILSSNYKLLYI